jgi:hypothetical protein
MQRSIFILVMLVILLGSVGAQATQVIHYCTDFSAVFAPCGSWVPEDNPVLQDCVHPLQQPCDPEQCLGYPTQILVCPIPVACTAYDQCTTLADCDDPNCDDYCTGECVDYDWDGSPPCHWERGISEVQPCVWECTCPTPTSGWGDDPSPPACCWWDFRTPAGWKTGRIP